MRYELTDLKVFLAIAAARSLSGGAADMHLTAPSASYRLKNLEQAMGAPLFERTPKVMALTPAGLTVKRYADSILGNVERLNEEMKRHTDGVAGHIRVFANSSTLNALMPTLSRFLLAYPNVNVELEERLSADVIRAIKDGSADIGLAAGEIDLHGVDAITYARDELVFAVPPGHALSAWEKIALDMALSHDLIGLGKKSSNHVFLANLAEQLGVTPKVRVHASSFADALVLVKEGIGIALLPLSVTKPAADGGQLCVVRVDAHWAQRPQHIMVQSLAALQAHERAFVDFVAQQGSTAEAPR